MARMQAMPPPVGAGPGAGAGAGGEQPLEPVGGHDRHRLGRHERRLHPRHRVDLDLLLLHQPGVQDPEDLVVGGRSARSAAAGEDVGHERFQVGAGGRLKGGGAKRGALTLISAPAPVGSLPQEGLGLAQAEQVGGDGPLGAVLGAHVPLERPSEGGAGRLVHDTSGS